MSGRVQTTGMEQDGTSRLPQPTPESRPFWDACVRHELLLQRCADCARFWFPPGNRCQHCWREQFEWEPVSGYGQVHSHTVYRRAYAPDLGLPYVVAIVELDEGPRMATNIVECTPETVRVGMSVEVMFTDIGPDATLPSFRPRPGPDTPVSSHNSPADRVPR